MSGVARPVGRLKETINLDDLLLEDVANFSNNDSPLQLTCPNIIGKNCQNTLDSREEQNEPKIKAVGNHANYLDAVQLEEEEQDDIAPLPALKNKKKIDPRRQSTAIFSMFEATTSGKEGLLGDSELAIGDEDMELLIPITKSNATLASKGINNLWVDPDTDDAMLDETLPEPSLEEMHAVASAAATAAPSPGKQPGRSSKGCLGVRDSVAMFAGFSLACDSSPGIDKIKEDDFLSPRNNISHQKILETMATTRTAAAVEVVEEKKKIKVIAVPVRKPSRLKPPSSSSSFFSHKTTTTTAGGKTADKVAAASVARPPPPATVVGVQPVKKQLEPTPKPSVSINKTPTITREVSKTVEIIPEQQKKNPAPQSKPAQAQPAVRRLPASRLPAAAPLRSRLPKPAPPPTAAAAPVVNSLQPLAVAAVTKPKTLRSIATTIAAAAKTPIARAAAAAVEEPADDTPRTAHLRWLESHPELAFAGGPKIANSPDPEEVPKKKSAEEMHYESWGSSLTALNDRKLL